MPLLESDTVSDIDILEELEGLDDHVGCSYEQCDRSAVNFLICGIQDCDAAETICAEHTVRFLIIQLVSKTDTITFNHTCGHEPLICECQIKPMP